MLSILKMFPRETKEKKMVKKPEMSFTDVDKYLKNLELKSYSLIEIVDLIRNIPTLKKEGLFRDVIFDNYYNDNPNQPYCLFVIKPKLDKLEKQGLFD